MLVFKEIRRVRFEEVSCGAIGTNSVMLCTWSVLSRFACGRFENEKKTTRQTMYAAVRTLRWLTVYCFGMAHFVDVISASYILCIYGVLFQRIDIILAQILLMLLCTQNSRVQPEVMDVHFWTHFYGLVFQKGARLSQTLCEASYLIKIFIIASPVSTGQLHSLLIKFGYSLVHSIIMSTKIFSTLGFH